MRAEKLFCEADGISDIFPFKIYYDQRLKFLNKENKNAGYRPDPPIYNVILEVCFIFKTNIIYVTSVYFYFRMLLDFQKCTVWVAILTI